MSYREYFPILLGLDLMPGSPIDAHDPVRVARALEVLAAQIRAGIVDPTQLLGRRPAQREPDDLWVLRMEHNPGVVAERDTLRVLGYWIGADITTLDRSHYWRSHEALAFHKLLASRPAESNLGFAGCFVRPEYIGAELIIGQIAPHNGLKPIRFDLHHLLTHGSDDLLTKLSGDAWIADDCVHLLAELKRIGEFAAFACDALEIFSDEMRFEAIDTQAVNAAYQAMRDPNSFQPTKPDI